MAKPKEKTPVHEDWEKDEIVSDGKVQVLSLREGAIVLPEGTLKNKQTMRVSAERADWLVKSFPNEVRII
jgi:hypothetical protein